MAKQFKLSYICMLNSLRYQLRGIKTCKTRSSTGYVTTYLIFCSICNMNCYSEFAYRSNKRFKYLSFFNSWRWMVISDVNGITIIVNDVFNKPLRSED